MKKFMAVLTLSLLVYAIYFDLSKGTLSLVSTGQETFRQIENVDEKIHYFEKNVQRGDTLLSIVEAHLDGPLPVSVETVIEDFKKLNNGLHPQEMQYEKTYKFPKYESH